MRSPSTVIAAGRVRASARTSCSAWSAGVRNSVPAGVTPPGAALPPPASPPGAAPPPEDLTRPSAARASARLSGRDEVTIDDVREIAPYVLRHRILLDEGRSADDVLRTVLEQVPVPERIYTLR